MLRRKEADGLIFLGHRLPAEARENLTIAELCEELKIGRSTFYDWRAKGRAPKVLRLPNGDLRIRRTDLDTGLESREEVA